MYGLKCNPNPGVLVMKKNEAEEMSDIVMADINEHFDQPLLVSFTAQIVEESRKHLLVDLQLKDSGEVLYPEFPVNRSTYEKMFTTLDDDGFPTGKDGDGDILEFSIESLREAIRLFCERYIVPIYWHTGEIERIKEFLMEGGVYYDYEKVWGNPMRKYINNCLQYYLWKELVVDPIKKELFGGTK